MANVVLSSCCYNYVYSATGWSYSSTVGLGFEISGDANIMNGCYTIVSGVTGTTVTFDGTATSNAGCGSDCLSFCCSNTLCLNIQNNIYSGYSGNYNFLASYNGYPYWTGGTSNTGYIYHNNTYWCLSNSLGGTCYFFGSNPTSAICPDFDETILSSGACVPSPTPTDP